MVKITEVFSSIQGEGPNIGRPAVFVRLYGCNLRCTFGSKKGCDSYYSVKGDDYKEYTVEELANEIRKYNINYIVFTGGEPLLQQRFIMEVMLNLNENYINNVQYIADIETNGTIPVAFYLHPFINLFVISPKLLNSKQESDAFDTARKNYNSLKSFDWKKSVLKFVVENKNDMVEIENILNLIEEIVTVYLMPMGETREEVIKTSPEVVNLCMETKFMFSPREHIMIYNNERKR